MSFAQSSLRMLSIVSEPADVKEFIRQVFMRHEYGDNSKAF